MCTKAIDTILVLAAHFGETCIVALGSFIVVVPSKMWPKAQAGLILSRMAPCVFLVKTSHVIFPMGIESLSLSIAVAMVRPF
jgi:hypothetical protein